MKHLHYTLLLAGLFSTTAFAQDSGEAPYQTKNFTGSLSGVRVSTSGGSITVEGGQSDGVKVDMYVRGNNWPQNKLSKAEIEERLKEYDIEVKTEGATVVATARRKQETGNWDWKRSLSISFKVSAPRNFTTDLKTSGGSIHISKLIGQQDFATSGGGLHLTDVEGAIRGRTSGGSIHLDNCRKDIDVTTSGGSIEAKNSSGKMTLRTSGGSVRLNDLKGQVKATTSGGSIQAEGVDGELVSSTSGGSIRLSGISGSLEAHTSGGSIEAEITRVGSFLKLSASAGTVRVRMPLDQGLDLDVRGNKVSMPLSKFDGEVEKDRIRGRMNGGGVPVTISASSGNVYVNQ
ncbi:MAG: DUF4097 domain-containing protein [Cytophagaceae bacterium]|nr:DUF4097 domain-containing protein [Cytophagaceae bacterium]